MTTLTREQVIAQAKGWNDMTPEHQAYTLQGELKEAQIILRNSISSLSARLERIENLLAVVDEAQYPKWGKE